jgi:predicted nuclease with RNAse H fold/dephospho-CoA kinase
MAQWMLPFPDTAADQINPGRLRKRVLGPARSSSRLLDHRLGSALADPSRVVFLDVETTGLSWFYDELTMVGWVCGGSYELHIAGGDPAPLLEALKAAHTLVTFNGTLFDLRFLRKTLGELALPPVHIDLRYLAKRVGLVGGQKAIERAIGLPDRVGLESMDGAEAVLLWHRYLRGDEAALGRLIDYNRWDVVGMCGILDHVMDRLDVHPDLLFRRIRFAERAYATCTQAIPRTTTLRNVERSLHTIDAMFRGTPGENAAVIGIDLTGSEARPSGWCLLRGSEAETCMISSDDDMFSRAMSERPALISIDSPLSLPFGRTRVEDDDPGRDRFGIMRRCERELKRRGVNVYPSLLPSMQGLTRRGIRLAERFRSAGMPVIESYPGAAQDIMGIPRKGAGTEFLRQGLVDFGIRGSSIDHGAGHDELDAITSALVGLFFLSSQYEALRGPSEGALIIPELKSVRQGGGMVVGISGRICAGKTTSARILEQRGFAYTRFSLVIDDEVISRGDVPNRATRQRVGAEINRTHGQRWLCEKVLERVAGEKLVVVDGLRFPEDHAFFVERFGSEFVHLHIQASDGHRASRYAESEQVNSSFEMTDRQPVEAKVGELVKLASAVLQNDGSIAQLTEIVLNSARMRYNGRDRECLSRLL